MSAKFPISRRHFLGTGLAAASAVASTGNTAVAECAPALPPAIAALPSLSGQARPFIKDERQARIERAKALMTEAKVDAIVLAGDTNSHYFADLRISDSERLWAVVIPARSKPFLVCPAFEEARAHEMLADGPLGKDADVLVWQEDESPFATLGKGLGDRGLGSAIVGLDENMKFVFAEGIRAANPHLTAVNASPVTAGCRMIKDAHEIECMRLALRRRCWPIAQWLSR